MINMADLTLKDLAKRRYCITTKKALEVVKDNRTEIALLAEKSANELATILCTNIETLIVAGEDEVLKFNLPALIAVTKKSGNDIELVMHAVEAIKGNNSVARELKQAVSQLLLGALFEKI